MSVAGQIQLWSKKITKDFSRIYDTQENSYELGDLLLRDHVTFYHAGIYCANNEVIDFMGSERKRQSVLKKDVHEYGTVSKKSVKHFKGEKKIEVYRLREKSKFPKNLAKNAEEAMDKFIKYHLLNFNCLHFALCVLEVNDWPKKSSSAPTGTAPGGYEAISMSNI